MLPKDFCPNAYENLLTEKIGGIANDFEALGAPFPTIVASPTNAFRMRAEFRVWHEDDNLYFVMFDQEAPKIPVPIKEFPIASKAIQEIFAPLRGALKANPELRRKLFQVEFLSTQSGEVLATLIYHRQLDDAWETEARVLADNLNIMLIGRSRGQKVTLSRDWVEESLTINSQSYRYKQPEQAFIQPNAYVNERMIEWAVDQIADQDSDLLELYCGIGNFTIPLATLFRRVLATEVSKVATRAAIDNLSLNNVGNVEFARLSAEEMTVALAGARSFRRLASLDHSLEDYDLRTVFVDPPRAGLDPGTLSLVKDFDEILYISCNPLTLINNLKELTETHTIEALAFFDQFPYTPHLECGVHLKQRPETKK